MCFQTATTSTTEISSFTLLWTHPTTFHLSKLVSNKDTCTVRLFIDLFILNLFQGGLDFTLHHWQISTKSFREKLQWEQMTKNRKLHKRNRTSFFKQGLAARSTENKEEQCHEVSSLPFTSTLTWTFICFPTDEKSTIPNHKLTE